MKNKTHFRFVGVLSLNRCYHNFSVRLYLSFRHLLNEDDIIMKINYIKNKLTVCNTGP